MTATTVIDTTQNGVILRQRVSVVLQAKVAFGLCIRRGNGGGQIAGSNGSFTVIDTMPDGTGMGRIHRSGRHNDNFFIWTME